MAGHAVPITRPVNTANHVGSCLFLHSLIKLVNYTDVDRSECTAVAQTAELSFVHSRVIPAWLQLLLYCKALTLHTQPLTV